MSFIKKWIGCFVSFICGVCGLALSACSGMIAVAKVDGSALKDVAGIGDTSATFVDNTTKAFKVLTDNDLYTQAKDMGIKAEFLTMKVFAIISLVIAVILIAYAIVLLLKNLNVIKCNSKVFDYITIGLLILFVVSVIGLFVSSLGYANAMETELFSVVKSSYSAGFTAKLTYAGMAPAQIEALLGMHKYNASVTLGMYQPLMLAISIVGLGLALVFHFINHKKA